LHKFTDKKIPKKAQKIQLLGIFQFVKCAFQRKVFESYHNFTIQI